MEMIFTKDLYTLLSAMTSDVHWRPHIYVDMTHMLRHIVGFIGGITTLDDNEKLTVLAVIHCQFENMESYVKLFESFKICYPRLSIIPKIAVSRDGDKGIDTALQHCLANAVIQRCIHHLLKHVSKNENNPAILQLRRTAYARTKESFEEELKSFLEYPEVYRLIQHLRDERCVGEMFSDAGLHCMADQRILKKYGRQRQNIFENGYRHPSLVRRIAMQWRTWRNEVTVA